MTAPVDAGTAPAGLNLEEQLAAATDGLSPIVCFANDWNGDPTSKHHIMRILGRHVPVLWVESAGMRRPDLWNVADLRRIASRVRRAVGRRSAEQQPSAQSTGASDVRVVSPLGIPLPGNAVAERINGMLYRRAVSRAMPADTDPILWVYTPTVAPYLDGIPHSALVYHCVDRWWAFTEYDATVMRRHHADLCRRADVVFASAAELLDDCREHAPHAILMRHGVDWSHFARAAFDPPPRPRDLSDIRGPIIGFFGLLHDWIDQDLLIGVARSQPEATMVLVGKAPADISRLLAEPNVRWVGQKPFADLPAYAAAFDVAMVPFVRNELTAAVNPIKLLEYLSAGVPVVATDLPEISAMAPRDGLHVARANDDFVRFTALALAQQTSSRRRQVSAGQQQESWAGRCVAMAVAVKAAGHRGRQMVDMSAP